MDLRQALSVLSKSSPYAVTTTGEPKDPFVKRVKEYLFVETDIELAFKEKLKNAGPSDIIFLCGSSGDGKSEILTRYKTKYEDKAEFHLDATHSFDPKATAIETLNDLFHQHKCSSKALVVGINIGMMANYEREGSEEHLEIKQAISKFLTHQAKINSSISFLDFESFPKFSLSGGEISSTFFKSLLDKVVRDDSRNLFRDLFNDCLGGGNDRVLVANYLMLRSQAIQKVIIEILLYARICHDQFITARTLLDFIYCILTGPGYLFDNIFDGGDNELLESITDADPSLVRNKPLDHFILHKTLGFDDSLYGEFLEEIKSKYHIRKSLPPKSAIRLFYLFKYLNLGCNYHREFRELFQEEAKREYVRIWEMHKHFTGDLEQKRALRKFYDEIVFTAINKHSNRNAPFLSKDEFYISSHGGCDLATEMEISVIYDSIKNDSEQNLAYFNVYLQVNGHELEPMPVGVNLLALMMDIVNGYRPNKHDKNSIVLLDELVSKITEMGSLSSTLYLYSGGDRIKLKSSEEGEIRVSGL